jgi:uncharacterized protein (DUF305 family)
MLYMIRNIRMALLLIAGVAAACAPHATTVGTVRSQPAEAGDAAAHQHHMSELPATAGPGYTVADVRFMQHMIGHHAQAIQMAALAPSHGASDKLQQLAQKIDISQRDEIAMMKQWLNERKQVVPTDMQSHAMMMPGMLTPQQFAQLAAARGREFDRLFLTFMIRHHEGALLMVEELFKQPGAGQEPDIFRFATDVDADQRDEIYVMQKLLDTMS